VTDVGTVEPVPAKRSGTAALLGAVGLGAFVSVALGTYGSTHDAAGQALFTLGFSGTINMKAWLATLALVLAVVQVLLALWMYGRLGGHAPAWIGPLHRLVGLTAFVVILPVVYHCLWSLGFEGDIGNTRRFVHSVAGCAFFGAFTVKVLAVRSKSMPSWTLPVFGGLVFALLTLLWLTSSLWFFRNVGFPKF
jgi:hypothetical protein